MGLKSASENRRGFDSRYLKKLRRGGHTPLLKFPGAFFRRHIRSRLASALLGLAQGISLRGRTALQIPVALFLFGTAGPLRRPPIYVQ